MLLSWRQAGGGCKDCIPSLHSLSAPPYLLEVCQIRGCTKPSSWGSNRRLSQKDWRCVSVWSGQCLGVTCQDLSLQSLQSHGTQGGKLPWPQSRPVNGRPLRGSCVNAAPDVYIEATLQLILAVWSVAPIRKQWHPQALARQRESVWLASTSLYSWRVSQQAPVPPADTALTLANERLSPKVWVLFKELLLCCALGRVIPVLRALLESLLSLLHPHGSQAHAPPWFSKPGVWRDSSFRCRS